VGIEFRQGDQLRYIALAQNNKGFENINRFLSYHNNSGKPIPEKAPRIEDTYIIYPFGTIAPELLLENEYIGIRSTQLTQLIRAEERKYPQKLVAWQPVTFANKKSFNIHKLLRAIDQNTLISKLECHLLAQPDEVMQPYEALKNTYQHYPTLLYNAEKLLSNCALEVTLGVPKNKKHFYESRATDLQILRAEAEAGFQQRYHHAMTDDALYQERFERELDII
jgi:DNA polymerase III alpha subunit